MKKKSIFLISLGIIVTALVAVLVVYVVNKPKKLEPLPSSSPVSKASYEPIGINQVTTGSSDVCLLKFTVEDQITPVCNETCNQTNLICPSGLECVNGVCRNPSCVEEADCVCEISSPSPSISPSPTPPNEANLDCIVKRVYEDDTQNTAGVYYLNHEIIDTNTLTNNQVVVYNIVVANTGEVEVPSVTIDDLLSNNLSFMDASDGCSYDESTRLVKCNIEAIPANTETSRSIRVRVAVAGTTAINNRAEVYSTNGQRDVCEITVGATGIIEQPDSPAPSALPEAGVMEVTTTTLGLGVLFLILGGIGLLVL